MLQVRDEGPGMDEKQAGRVFDRFYRGDGLGPGERFGSRAVHRGHCGQVTRWRSERDTAGKGATFTVVLPSREAGPQRGYGRQDHLRSGERAGLRRSCAEPPGPG